MPGMNLGRVKPSFGNLSCKGIMTFLSTANSLSSELTYLIPFHEHFALFISNEPAGSKL